MEAIEELSELADATRQASALLADDDPSEQPAQRRGGSSFLTVVALGNIVRIVTYLPNPAGPALEGRDLVFWLLIWWGIGIVIPCVCAGSGEIRGAQWIDRPPRSRQYSFFSFVWCPNYVAWILHLQIFFAYIPLSTLSMQARFGDWSDGNGVLSMNVAYRGEWCDEGPNMRRSSERCITQQQIHHAANWQQVAAGFCQWVIFQLFSFSKSVQEFCVYFLT